MDFNHQAIFLIKFILVMVYALILQAVGHIFYKLGLGLSGSELNSNFWFIQFEKTINTMITWLREEAWRWYWKIHRSWYHWSHYLEHSILIKYQPRFFNNTYIRTLSILKILKHSLGKLSLLKKYSKVCDMYILILKINEKSWKILFPITYNHTPSIFLIVIIIAALLDHLQIKFFNFYSPTARYLMNLLEIRVIYQ